MNMFLAASVGLIGGIGLGYLFFYATQGRKIEDNKAAELELELQRYRDQVHSHFSHTSELFQDVTKQYRALYDHLAQGAESLCDPILPTPELGLEEKALIGQAQPSERETEAETQSSAQDAGESSAKTA